MMKSRGGALIVVALAMALAGCGARQPAGFSQRFVRPGEPKVHFGSPLQPTPLEDYVSQVRRLAAGARPQPKQSLLPTMEARDPELASALLMVVAAPSPGAHRRVAESYRRLGIDDAAFEHFTRALALDPRDAAAYEGRARLWRDWGFPRRGLPDAHRAVYHAPQSASARNTFGTLLQAQGRRAEARLAFEQVLALDAAAAYALNNLCYLDFLDGSTARAVARCRAAIEADPRMTAARHNLALVYAASGRLDLARREFLDAGPAGVADFNLGIVHMAGKRYAQAAELFTAAAASDPAWRAAVDRRRQARALAARADGGGSR